MAQKRMFSLQIVDTDKFMDMSTSAQALYFHLGMHGDDNGFVSSPRKIARATGCNDDDLRLLASKGYIIPFESGVIVITDWAINNTLRNDRYHETVFQAEKALLAADKSGRYSLVSNLDTKWIPDGANLEPEPNLTKPNLTEQNKESTAPPAVPPAPASGCSGKPTRKKYGQYGWVQLTDEEYSRLSNDFGQAEVERCIAYIDESAQSTGNKNKWRDWNLVIRRCHRDGWGLGKGAGKSDARSAVKTAADYDSGEDFASNWNLQAVDLGGG